MLSFNEIYFIFCLFKIYILYPRSKAVSAGMYSVLCSLFLVNETLRSTLHHFKDKSIYHGSNQKKCGRTLARRGGRSHANQSRWQLLSSTLSCSFLTNHRHLICQSQSQLRGTWAISCSSSRNCSKGQNKPTGTGDSSSLILPWKVYILFINSQKINREFKNSFSFNFPVPILSHIS